MKQIKLLKYRQKFIFISLLVFFSYCKGLAQKMTINEAEGVIRFMPVG
jgi:hypothetical protein